MPEQFLIISRDPFISHLSWFPSQSHPTISNLMLPRLHMQCTTIKYLNKHTAWTDHMKIYYLVFMTCHSYSRSIELSWVKDTAAFTNGNQWHAGRQCPSLPSPSSSCTGTTVHFLLLLPILQLSPSTVTTQYLQIFNCIKPPNRSAYSSSALWFMKCQNPAWILFLHSTEVSEPHQLSCSAHRNYFGGRGDCPKALKPISILLTASSHMCVPADHNEQHQKNPWSVLQ